MNDDATIKTRSPLRQTEIEAQREKFLKAYSTYIDRPSRETLAASQVEAKELRRIQQLYEDGRHLLRARISDRIRRAMR